MGRVPVDGQAGRQGHNWSKDEHGVGTTSYAEDSGREGGKINEEVGYLHGHWSWSGRK